MKKEIKEKILCKTCYFKDRFKGEDWCKIIENEGGGSIPAVENKCGYYLKKGTEPKWLCCKCGKNTYGESSTSTKGKHYCSDCWIKKEILERKQREAQKYREDIKKVAEVLGDKKKAKEIVDLITLKE